MELIGELGRSLLPGTDGQQLTMVKRSSVTKQPINCCSARQWKNAESESLGIIADESPDELPFPCGMDTNQHHGTSRDGAVLMHDHEDCKNKKRP